MHVYFQTHMQCFYSYCMRPGARLTPKLTHQNVHHPAHLCSSSIRHSIWTSIFHGQERREDSWTADFIAPASTPFHLFLSMPPLMHCSLSSHFSLFHTVWRPPFLRTHTHPLSRRLRLHIHRLALLRVRCSCRMLCTPHPHTRVMLVSSDIPVHGHHMHLRSINTTCFQPSHIIMMVSRGGHGHGVSMSLY
jgi:hypothetical protein